MSIVTDFIKLDKEYGALLDCVKDAMNSHTPLPTLVSGLSEGAFDATLVTLVQDLKKEGKAVAFPSFWFVSTKQPPVLLGGEKRL